MSRMKSVFAIAVLIAIAGAVQAANAQATLKALIVGASGSWQAMAVGTYKTGHCPTGSRAGCGHATYGKPTAVNLIDSRPAGTLTDTGGSLWIVWDNTTADANCTTSCNVWAYLKVDSIVGNRCFFATPRCTVQAPSFSGTPDNLISGIGAAWPSEVDAPATVKAIFTAGHAVNVAASEIRPEDAAFGQCRINSTLGGGSDGLNGLGYGLNASGVCPTFTSPAANKAGNDLHSAYPASTSTAHPIAFNIIGNDPYTNSVVPAFTTINVGAVPLIFITNRQDANGLGPVTDVSLRQLQTVFSGASCFGSDLGNSAGTSKIAAMLREPLSGTMNSAEYTAFRLPRDASGNYDTVNGSSQETGIGGIDPVSNLACSAGGSRYRLVGTGDETKAVQHSADGTLPTSTDSVGYIFFSYGNVSSLAHDTRYGYLQVNHVDPIFQLYNSTYDPGESTLGAGVLPKTSDLPASCAGAFPCSETAIWKGKLSFPNVRSGAYRQWIMVRLVGSTGSAPLAAAQALVTSAQQGAVSSVPDFIPAVATTVGTFTDPGLKLLHSHYLQSGKAPVNAGTTEAGGDVGGCILGVSSTAVSLVYRDPSPCTKGP